MTDGLILLGFIALLVAVAVGWARRRVGLSVTRRSTIVTFTGIVIAVLIIWVVNRR